MLDHIYKEDLFPIYVGAVYNYLIYLILHPPATVIVPIATKSLMISRLLLLICHKSLCVSLWPISSLTPPSTFNRGVYPKPSDCKSAAQTHILMCLLLCRSGLLAV